MSESIHIPVLVEPLLELLAVQSGQTIADGTLGGGGHTRLLAERVGPNGVVIAVDRDPLAVRAAEQSLRGLPVRVAQANYCELPEVLEECGITALDGVLLDLGLSSDQLACRERGFSYESDGPLDLRFDPESGEPAWRLIERMTAEQLADIIYQYGEERLSRRIARRIVESRRQTPIRTAAQLAELVSRCVPRSRGHQIHPATRTFQALRIAVNDELGSLDRALKCIPELLKPGGRFAVISFHSLEDRRVKEAFRGDTRLERVTKKPIRPADDEIHRNVRSRSARLRVAAKRF